MIPLSLRLVFLAFLVGLWTWIVTTLVRHGYVWEAVATGTIGVHQVTEAALGAMRTRRAEAALRVRKCVRCMRGTCPTHHREASR